MTARSAATQRLDWKSRRIRLSISTGSTEVSLQHALAADGPPSLCIGRADAATAAIFGITANVSADFPGLRIAEAMCSHNLGNMRVLSVVPENPASPNHSVPNVKEVNQPKSMRCCAMTGRLLESRTKRYSLPSDEVCATGTETEASARARFIAGERLLRAAQCLTALLQAPTSRAGLNEARYNVLDALWRQGPGGCSQSELAAQLLQSESNLSTLVDRMRQAGLITRVRSESDRRVALIGVTTEGREALARADRSRRRAAVEIFHVLGEQQTTVLDEALSVLLERLERVLGISGTTVSRNRLKLHGLDASRPNRRGNRPDQPAADETTQSTSLEGAA